MVSDYHTGYYIIVVTSTPSVYRHLPLGRGGETRRERGFEQNEGAVSLALSLSVYPLPISACSTAIRCIAQRILSGLALANVSTTQSHPLRTGVDSCPVIGDRTS